MSKISEYATSLSAFPEYKIGVEIQGFHGVVTNHGVIIFSTGGSQCGPVVEAFLGGLMYAKLK